MWVVDLDLDLDLEWEVALRDKRILARRSILDLRCNLDDNLDLFFENDWLVAFDDVFSDLDLFVVLDFNERIFDSDLFKDDF